MVDHVVRIPRPAFRSKNGCLEVHQVTAWQDNLVWVVACLKTRECFIVDGPVADGALALIEKEGFTLRGILNTHTHPDHVGVNRDLAKRGLLDGLEVIGPARDAERVPGLTRGVDEGDEVTIGSCTGRVLLTEGHIKGHVSYVFQDILFCGDTLFGAGCGYLFDGPPAAMHASLEKLAALDESTRVCCAHEYTEDNLRFAWSIDSKNEALANRIREVWALRERGECSVPSTIGEERATNPFLRHHDAGLRDALMSAIDVEGSSAAETFAATRRLKDRKDYKKASDDTLPL